MSTKISQNTTDLRELLDAVNNLPEREGEDGGAVLQALTVEPTTAQQVFNPDGFDGYAPVTVEAMPTASQATPVIAVNDSGTITATTDQAAGYVAGGVKTATEQLPTQGAQTVKPGTTDTVIPAGKYLTGDQTIQGDPNLIADNIRKGVSIFDVLGIFEGDGGSGAGAGGSLPSGIKALSSGTVTPAASGSTLEITHNLGAVPTFLVWWNTTDFSSSVETSAAYLGFVIEKQVKTSSAGTTIVNHHYSVHGYNSNGGTGQTGSRLQNTDRMTATTATLVSNTTYLIKAGHTYRWICGVVE